MTLKIRPVKESDVEACGAIIYEAFRSIAERHGFAPDFPNRDAAVQLCGAFIRHPDIFGVVAEHDGQGVGCNFLSRCDAVGAVGPITIAPDFQGRGVGRMLMQAVIDHGRSCSQLRSIRLVQDAFNAVSMSLYASLGFEAKEPLMLMSGRPKEAPQHAGDVRPLAERDLEACGELCQRVHGFTRNSDLRDAIRMLNPFVLERDGRVRACCSAPNFWPLNHGVAQSREDMQELLLGVAAATEQPLAMLVPIRDAELFRWCLRQQLRILKPMNLMAMGEYREPQGCFYPSVLY